MTTETMTPQQIFDKAYLGLKAQGKCSFKDGDRDICRYRGTGGRKCGVGMLIPKKIGQLWDGQNSSDIETIVENHLDGVKPWMEENLQLLTQIQWAHDNIADWSNDFECFFADVADSFNLTVPA